MARIDALPKVLGCKIFARDLRAPDIKGRADAGDEDWGLTTFHALLLRSPYCDRSFDGVDLDVAKGLQATKAFTRYGDRFIDKLADPANPESYEMDFAHLLFGQSKDRTRDGVDLFVDVGTTAEYVGQPVAMLLFDDVRHYLDAEREAVENSPVLRFARPAADSATSFEATDVISGALDRWLGTGIEPAESKRYGSIRRYSGMTDGARCSTVDKAFAQASFTLNLRTETPSVDPCFLEPEAALGRLSNDGDRLRITLYLGTQSSEFDRKSIAKHVKRLRASNVEIRNCHLGGGFGGRDFSLFPIYAAIAVLIGQGTPVRLAWDRYAQFLAGTKRHASCIDNTLALASNGDLLALRSRQVFDGGSQKDLSTAVGKLAALSGGGAYRIEHWDIRLAPLRNNGPLAGSMRGFGVPQV
ncbi:MAG: molybdopterin-dependent oxidoreductase [Defluviicoccus sp.]|nr:molybdopterin-dependent oxidoreductase [Defluviicoccus sp.]